MNIIMNRTDLERYVMKGAIHIFKDLWNLFWAFAKIGTFTFGGGYAMLPMIEKEVVEKYHWATNQEVVDYFAIGQCTPGVIAVNTATFVGYKQKGAIGGIIATLGVILPSILIICIIAAFLQNFSDIPQVQHAFAGIRVAVLALIISAVLKLWKSSVIDKFGMLTFCVVFVVMLLTKLSPVFAVILSAIAGILVKNYDKKEGEK